MRYSLTVLLMLLLSMSCGCVQAEDKRNPEPSKQADNSPPGPMRNDPSNAIVGLETPKSPAPHRVNTEIEAIRIADKLLSSFNANWGESRGVLKTGAGWYRISYGKDGRGVEKVVLVDPITGDASFPLPR